MKSRFFLSCGSVLGLVMVFLIFSLQAYAQQFETIQITDGTQKFRNPVWSPNGTKLAFWGPGGIYVAKSDGTEQPLKIFNTFGEDLMWASDSELVYWQRKFNEIKEEGKKPRRENIESVKIVNLSGIETVAKEGSAVKGPFKLNDGSIMCYRAGESYDIVRSGKLSKEALGKQLSVTSHYPPVYSSATKRSKYDDTDIWIASLDGSFRKRVTYGKQYYFPQLSPDRMKILVYEPVTSDIIVLDTSGNELTKLGIGVIKISDDLRTMVVGYNVSWSPDSKKIVYLLDTENIKKEDVVNCDIYVINEDGSERIQITNTPNEIEMDPEWSPDGTKIACYSDNSGKIFVIKLK